MNLTVKLGTVLMFFLMAGAFAAAQDQAKAPSEPAKSFVRVDFVFTEYNGQQKVSSLPYTMYVEAVASGAPHPGKLRIRDNFHVQVETDIDCFVFINEDGSYEVEANLNMFSVYSAADGRSEPTANPSANDRPVNRTFTDEFNVKLHDGETVEGASATDPFNGHVIKVTVTLHVMK